MELNLLHLIIKKTGRVELWSKRAVTAGGEEDDAGGVRSISVSLWTRTGVTSHSMVRWTVTGRIVLHAKSIDYRLY